MKVKFLKNTLILVCFLNLLSNAYAAENITHIKYQPQYKYCYITGFLGAEQQAFPKKSYKNRMDGAVNNMLKGAAFFVAVARMDNEGLSNNPSCNQAEDAGVNTYKRSEHVPLTKMTESELEIATTATQFTGYVGKNLVALAYNTSKN